MAYYLNSDPHLDPGPIYVREHGQLHVVDLALEGVRSRLQRPRPFRLFPKGFSVELCMNREDDTARREKTDHFIFTYTREGNLRYSAKSLFSLVLGFISDNVDHIDSLIGFPEQIAEKLFSAAEARQKFAEPGAGLRALRKFTEAYGSLVLCSLCLRNRYLVVSEKLEEIKSFRELTCLDLSCCKLGDDHELLEHLTNEALSSITQLHLKDNCLSDAGVRKMTAPVRVMKRGLESLTLLDLSCNKEEPQRLGMKPLSLLGSQPFLHSFQIVLQWERVTVEAGQPRKDMAPRKAAQYFYQKAALTEASRKCPLADAHMNSSGRLQFYRERAADPALSQESKKSKKRASEEPQQEPKFARLAVEDWDLLNSY
uniref:Leucine-rich repeat-containing protein 42 n=1 Tax=Jaculus jaculus TaxID=51337 RepID=A0A8C5K916_JACJA